MTLFSAYEALIASADACETTPVIALVAKELAEPPMFLKSRRRQDHGSYALVVQLEACNVKGAPTRTITADKVASVSANTAKAFVVDEAIVL